MLENDYEGKQSNLCRILAGIWVTQWMHLSKVSKCTLKICALHCVPYCM